MTDRPGAGRLTRQATPTVVYPRPRRTPLLAGPQRAAAMFCDRLDMLGRGADDDDQVAGPLHRVRHTHPKLLAAAMPVMVP